jgi:hypothetical protein
VDGKPFKLEELDQMLAPIALYPDPLLAQILIASTYPLEVVQADRWVKQNSGLEEDEINAALDKMDWDPSIKALVPFPDVLSMMSEQLDWTQKLGDAFLAQQDDVMDSVQRLRAEAHARDNLESTSEQKVIVQDNIIQVEPADPEVVYVPAYDPVVVYGAWPYADYPPYYWAAPVVGAGLAFAAGVAVGVAWGHGWGNWNWGNHTINVNVNHNINVNNLKNTHIQTAKWEHDPAHRKGVAYRDQASRERYAQKYPGSAEARRDFRGYSQPTGERGLHPAGYNDANRQQPSFDRARDTGAAGRYGETGHGGSEQSRPAAFEGMNSGSSAREHSDRGFSSRQGSMGGGGGWGGGGGGGWGGGGGRGGGGGGGGGRR